MDMTNEFESFCDDEPAFSCVEFGYAEVARRNVRDNYVHSPIQTVKTYLEKKTRKLEKSQLNICTYFHHTETYDAEEFNVKENRGCGKHRDALKQMHVDAKRFCSHRPDMSVSKQTRNFAREEGLAPSVNRRMLLAAEGVARGAIRSRRAAVNVAPQPSIRSMPITEEELVEGGIEENPGPAWEALLLALSPGFYGHYVVARRLTGRLYATYCTLIVGAHLFVGYALWSTGTPMNRFLSGVIFENGVDLLLLLLIAGIEPNPGPNVGRPLPVEVCEANPCIGAHRLTYVQVVWTVGLARSMSILGDDVSVTPRLGAQIDHEGLRARASRIADGLVGIELNPGPGLKIARPAQRKHPRVEDPCQMPCMARMFTESEVPLLRWVDPENPSIVIMRCPKCNSPAVKEVSGWYHTNPNRTADIAMMGLVPGTAADQVKSVRPTETVQTASVASQCVAQKVTAVTCDMLPARAVLRQPGRIPQALLLCAEEDLSDLFYFRDLHRSWQAPPMRFGVPELVAARKSLRNEPERTQLVKPRIRQDIRASVFFYAKRKLRRQPPIGQHALDGYHVSRDDAQFFVNHFRGSRSCLQRGLDTLTGLRCAWAGARPGSVLLRTECIEQKTEKRLITDRNVVAVKQSILVDTLDVEWVESSLWALSVDTLILLAIAVLNSALLLGLRYCPITAVVAMALFVKLLPPSYFYPFNYWHPLVVERSASVAYVPHALSAVMREFRVQDPKTVEENVDSKLLRLAALPIDDDAACQLHRGTALVAKVLANKGAGFRYVGHRAPSAVSRMRM